MKRLKKALSIIALVVLIGTDFLNPISYAIEQEEVIFGVEENIELENEKEGENVDEINDGGVEEEEESGEIEEFEEITEEADEGVDDEKDIVENGLSLFNEKGWDKIINDENILVNEQVIDEDILGLSNDLEEDLKIYGEDIVLHGEKLDNGGNVGEHGEEMLELDDNEKLEKSELLLEKALSEGKFLESSEKIGNENNKLMMGANNLSRNTPQVGYFRAYDGSGALIFSYFNKTALTSFSRNTTLTEDEVLGKSGVKEIQSDDVEYSGAKIYGWVENNKFYWWSEANTVYFHPDTTSAFREMTAIQTIDLNGTSTELVENFAYWFNDNRVLTSIIGKINTNGVKMFDDSGVTYLETNEGTKTSGQGMSFMFNDCKKLTSVDLSEFNTTNVIDMKRMFAGCESMREIDVSNFDTHNVKTFYWMFRKMLVLQELDVSNFDTSSGISMLGMFTASKLKTLTLGENWNTSNVKLMTSMFYNMTELETIYADMDFNTGSLTDSNNMFNGDTKLVGGRGLTNETPYDKNKVKDTYARIASDEPAQRGYFTRRGVVGEEYTVRFVDRNGEVLWSGKLEYGVIPEYTGSQPYKNPTEKYLYSFDGWYPEIIPVVSDITYTAVYTESPRLYTVTLTGTPVGYGSLSTESLLEGYGAAIVISGNYLTIGGTEVILTGNEGYEFQEWTGNCGWIEKPICDENIIYIHPGVIEFTGSNSLIIRNPGYDLFSETNFQKDFEISFNILDIDLQNSSDKQATLISIKNEDLNNVWPGFTVRKGDNTNFQITANGGTAPSITVAHSSVDVESMRIKRKNSKLYISRNDGEDEEIYDYTGFGYYFDNPIAIGSIYKSGTPQRFIKATLSDIVIKSIDTSSCSSGVVLAVTGDCQMTAKFKPSEVNEYEISFVDEEDNPVDTQILGWNAEVNAPAVPTKAADDECATYEGSWTPAVHNVTGNQVYRATYECTDYQEYEISFVDEEDNPVDTQILGWDAEVNAPAVPTKAADDECATYEGSWTPAVHNVTGNQVYRATYECTDYQEYEISWLYEDGNLIETTVVVYGEVPTHADVDQPADEQYTYEFIGWTPTPIAATGDASYRATYKYIKNKYTITWLNEDGSLIDTTEVEYGEVPTHSNPTKPADDEYIYNFAGWIPELVVVTGAQTYTATYSAEKKEEHSESGGMSGGGGRGGNVDSEDNQHGSAEENVDGNEYTGDEVIDDFNKDVVPLYKWSYENKITTIDTLEEADPDGLVTRGHLAKMVVNYMVNVLGRKVPYDVTYNCVYRGDNESSWESDEIRDYATKACAFGVMGINMENNEFLPNNIVTRAEFGTVMSRVLWGDKYDIIDTDSKMYYEDHLQALKRDDILTQINDPEARWEIRKWVWLVFRRITEKKK